MYEPYEDMRGTDPPGWSPRPDLWRLLFDAIAAPPPDWPVRFIHRDFHQGNTMWRRGRLTRVGAPSRSRGAVLEPR